MRTTRSLVSLAVLCAFGPLAVGSARADEPVPLQAYPPTPPPPAPTYAPPPGYVPPLAPPAQIHYEEQPSWGLFVTGAALFGVSYLLTAVVGYVAASGFAFIPVAGPLFYWDSSNTADARTGNLGLILVTGVQLTGIALGVIGLVLKRKVAVKGPPVTLAPSLSPGGGGLAAAFRF
jgi:hypothetical protein